MNELSFHQIKIFFQDQLIQNLILSKREAVIEFNQILQFIFKIDYAKILSQSPRINKRQLQQIEKIINLRIKGTPLAYIFKEWDFYGRKFFLNKSCLIPRPDTELMIDILKKESFKEEIKTLLDLGSGSGVIGITAKLEIPSIDKLVLTDISKRCLMIIKKNLFFHNLSADIYLSDWFRQLPEQKFDVVVSNPPYIAKNDDHLIHLAFEPRRALIANNHGLSDIETIVKNGVNFLSDNGKLFIEHGYNQKQNVQEIFKRYNYKDIVSFMDLTGHYRITKGVRK
jgi:release factor glutamine methyltransferase